MKRSTAFLGVTLAVALGGCGGGDRPPEEVVREFVEAFDRADERACGELVTDDYVRSVSTGELAGEAAREACLDQLRQLESAPIHVELVPRVDVEGDTATVEIRLKIDDDRQRQRITLKRRDGEWRVDEVRPL